MKAHNTFRSMGNMPGIILIEDIHLEPKGPSISGILRSFIEHLGYLSENSNKYVSFLDQNIIATYSFQDNEFN